MSGKLSRRSLLGRLGLASAGATTGALVGSAAPAFSVTEPAGPAPREGQRLTSGELRAFDNVGVTATNYLSIDPYGMKASGAWSATNVGTVYISTPSDGSGTFWYAVTLPSLAVATSLTAWGTSGVIVELLSSTVDGTNFPGLTGPTRLLARADLTTGTDVGANSIKKLTVAADLYYFVGASRTYLLQVRNTKPGPPVQGIQAVSIGYEMPQTFLLPAPQRVYDSRNTPQGRLTTAEGERLITTIAPVTGSNFGGPAVPAKAVIMTLTLADTVASGFITAYSADAQPPLASNLNWYGTGQIVANTVMATLAPNGNLKLKVGGGGQTHVIIDVLGFLY